MNEPNRLRDGSSAASRLLRSAERDAPSERSRRRALAFAGAATTLASATTSAAAAGGTVFKAVALWVCAGALGGLVTAVTAGELSKPSPAAMVASPQRAAVPLAGDARPRGALPAPALAPAVAADPAPEAAALPARHPAPAAPAAPAGAAEAAEPAPSVADVPRAAAGSSVASFATDDPKPALLEELRQIEAARAEFGRGELTAALATLDAYARRYPAGSFRPEALALRIQALSQAGQRDRARALAADFKRFYPQHPLLSHVRAAVGE